MEWLQDGIVLTVRPLGEGSVILDALTRDHGRHLGVVRGGGSRRMAGVLESGNLVRLTWRARLAEQLGSYQAEPNQARTAAIFHDRIKLASIVSLCALVPAITPERHAYPRLFDALDALTDAASDMTTLEVAAAVVRFELLLLEELGFGLDLRECAATGTLQDLAFVSPKSGRAVSLSAGAPYRERLLRLPAFLTDANVPVSVACVADGLALTGFFLDRQLLSPHQKALPAARLRLSEMVAAGLGSD